MHINTIQTNIFNYIRIIIILYFQDPNYMATNSQEYTVNYREVRGEVFKRHT